MNLGKIREFTNVDDVMKGIQVGEICWYWADDNPGFLYKASNNKIYGFVPSEFEELNYNHCTLKEIFRNEPSK